MHAANEFVKVVIPWIDAPNKIIEFAGYFL
jgi:hypothetical protein